MTREEILKTAKPILFNTEMVKSILDGRKTQTRRIVKNNPEECTSKAVNGVCKICDDKGGFYLPDDYVKARSPYQVGNYLYVRETWGISNFDIDEQAVYIVYKAGDVRENCQKVVLPEDNFEHLYNNYSESEPDWRPSIHMPKEAARIFLRVTNVRVERLQDITEEDAFNEGFSGVPWCSHLVFENYPNSPIPCTSSDGSECPSDPPCSHSIPEMFGSEVWDRTIKKADLDKYGWKANPYVWVIEFERVEAE